MSVVWEHADADTRERCVFRVRELRTAGHAHVAMMTELKRTLGVVISTQQLASILEPRKASERPSRRHDPRAWKRASAVKRETAMALMRTLHEANRPLHVIIREVLRRVGVVVPDFVVRSLRRQAIAAGEVAEAERERAEATAWQQAAPERRLWKHADADTHEAVEALILELHGAGKPRRAIIAEIRRRFELDIPDLAVRDIVEPAETPICAPAQMVHGPARQAAR
jgi:hypothetical protein